MTHDNELGVGVLSLSRQLLKHLCVLILIFFYMLY